jgi:N-acetyl-gamma-glutamylphosphate reductase
MWMRMQVAYALALAHQHEAEIGVRRLEPHAVCRSFTAHARSLTRPALTSLRGQRQATMRTKRTR